MTNFIWRILVGDDANMALPTVPSLGNNFASITGYTAIGSIDRGDDADLDEDTVEVAYFDEDGEVMAPVALSRIDVVSLRNGIDSFGFICYDASKAVLGLASDVSQSGEESQKTLVTVKRTVIIEVNGVYADYFPNVHLKLLKSKAGIAADGAARTEFMAKCCRGSVVTSGHKRVNYA